ncbi:exo-alpha-sialidase [Verrucomicrobiota bacterium]
MRKFENGLSELTLAFEPGFEVDGEVVCRTFQPSYVVTRDGTLIAFCQGRLRRGSDDDPKMILTSSSDDRGATWSPVKIVSGRINHYAMSAYLSERDGRECVSVLTMVDLRVTENIYENDYDKMREQAGIDIDAVGRDTPMVLCRFDSDDGGDTWAMEALLGDRTPLNHCYPNGTLIMFNPLGQVHVIPEGPHEGRYVMGGPVTVVPEGETVTNHFRNHRQSGSAVIYSDDQGDTWRTDGVITDYLANEASAVSVNHGEELLLVRRLNPLRVFEEQPPLTDVRPGPMQRVAHTSGDCGKTWSQPFLVDISGVRCHGTLARVGRRLLFSIPSGSGLPESERQNVSDRQRGAIYFSDDEGQTWRQKIIEPETFSYSTVGRLNESQYITLFARSSMGQDGVGCRVFEDEWLSL